MSTNRPISPRGSEEVGALAPQLPQFQQGLRELTGREVEAAEAGDKPSLPSRAAQVNLAASDSSRQGSPETQMAILDALPAHVALLDAEGVIVAVNESWRRFAAANVLQSTSFGVGENYLTVCEHAHGECAEEARAAAAGIRQVLNQEIAEFGLEYPCPSPTELRWFRLMVTPLSGTPRTGVVVMHINVTQRRLVEEALRASEASKRAVWDSSLDGIITMDHEGTITDFNPGAERIFRHRKSEVIGRSLVEVLIPLSFRARYRHGFHQHLSTGEGPILGRRVELEALRGDGAKFPVELTIVEVTGGFRPVFVGTVRDITERKRAEEERDRLFNLSLDMLCVANFNGWLEQVNPAWTECLGWSAAELTSRPMSEFILPEDHAASTQIRERIHAGESVRGFENRYRCKDGSYRWFSWNVHPLIESHQVFAVARDITARKQAEEHLREREAILASAQRMGRMGNWDLNVHSGRLVWSEATCDLFGIAPAEFTETFDHFYSFILPEDRPRYDAIHRDLSRTHPILEAEYRIRRPDGEVCWMYERGHVEFDAGGRELRRSGMVMDVTELKASEQERDRLFEQLQASEQQYRVLFQNNPIAMWAFDVETLRFLAVNDTAVQQYGYSQAEFLAMTIRDIRPEADVADLEARLAELSGGQNELGLWQHRKKDGSIIDVEICADQAVFNGRPARLVLAFDVTARLRGERELARTHRALKMLGSGNEAMIRAKSEQGLLRDICQIAVEIGGYRMAWVGYAMADATKSIAPQAFAGVENAYLTTLEITWNEETESGRGPVGQVIRSGQVVAVPDLAAEPSFAPWQAAATARGFRSMVALPLRQQGRSFGALMLYLAEARSLLADELQLLQELADNLAFGIVTLRERAERQRLQGAVLAIAQESERAAAQVREQAALLDKAQDAIVVRDLDHHITYWNKSAERLYGWTAEEARGRLFPELLAVDGEKFREADEAVRAGGEWNGEIRKRARNGHHLTLDARWTLVRNESDQPQSILSIDTDITERRKLEQQFLRAQRMESIGTLAGGIAHDLNNALGPIITALELLQMRFPDPDSQDLIEMISASAQRGADMVKQVLSFGRGVEGQRLEIQIKPLIKRWRKSPTILF